MQDPRYAFLQQLGIQSHNYGAFLNDKWQGSGEVVTSYNPNDNSVIATTQYATAKEYEQGIQDMLKVQAEWSLTPIPLRGEVVRQIGEAFRVHKDALGMLISMEMGKIRTEGLGEVQEIIDICDMACGLSRSLNGLVIPSERPNHFMMERWNPLGIVGVITAFNFPAAVLGWNLAIALICGNLVVFKGAPTTNLVSIAVSNIITAVLRKNGFPTSILFTCLGDGVEVGEAMCRDPRVALISFTGSTKIGRHVNKIVAERFGKCILELGGNNAQIVMEDAKLDMALKAAVFGAVGTCGQRCTSLRRLILQNSIADQFIEQLVKVYGTIRVGDSMEDATLCGPLHSKGQVTQFVEAVKLIQSQGGKLLYGGQVVHREGNFVTPTIFEVAANSPLLKEELFMPVLFVVRFDSIEEAIHINNNVPQGLSSTMFTQNLSNQYLWTGPTGSDCGIVNVNIGTSGAEIGGAFGGEKETGGGRESGSDSWKQYMKRQTCTINFGKTLPLAQGVKFDI